MINIDPRMHPGHVKKYHSKLTMLSEHNAPRAEYSFPVKLDWERNPHMQAWNEICAWSIEHFGLPGDQYRTEINEDYMIWHFKNKDNQLLMSVAWGNDNGTDI